MAWWIILGSMNSNSDKDSDIAKGSVETDRAEDAAESNMANLDQQLDHRFQEPMNKSNDAGMPEAGQTPEYSMEKQGENELRKDTESSKREKDADAEAEADTQDQDPGERQRRNQQDADDPLAA